MDIELYLDRIGYDGPRVHMGPTILDLASWLTISACDAPREISLSGPLEGELRGLGPNLLGIPF